MGAWWDLLGLSAYLLGAISCAAFALWVMGGKAKSLPAGGAIAAALMITAIWALTIAAVGADHPLAIVTYSGSHLAWLWALYRLFAKDGRHQSLTPIRPVVAVLALIEIAQPVLAFSVPDYDVSAQARASVIITAISLRLLTSAGALVLVHNLFVGAAKSAQPILRWPASALAAFWLFELNYAASAYITGELPDLLGAMRSFLPLAMVFLLAIGSTGERAATPLRPSRTVAFQTASIILIGGYLAAMAFIGNALSIIGGDFARLVQVLFVVAASAIALLAIPSKKLRSTLRVNLVKHLFQHRYDYRAEWLRFNQTLSRPAQDAAPLPERVVQAMADITDSPAGLLLMPGGQGDLELAARWQWPTIEVPDMVLATIVQSLFERQQFIIEIDDLRDGRDVNNMADLLPDWLYEDCRVWALVPLLHFERLVGVIVLARPSVVRKLDWEDFDLLRLAAQQLASYLAEQTGQEALMEASRFDEFNRRIAFVMHDIKNLASQISLLASNAEKHAEKPKFRADMLVTLQNSSEKLNTLLARLSRYGASGTDEKEPVQLSKFVWEMAQRMAGGERISVPQADEARVTAHREGLEQAVLHLLQNAIDASADNEPIFLSSSTDGINGIIEIADSGTGMSAEFLRNGLFKPFVSSKQGGFGIGAFEARELVSAMGGRLEVDSREGLGTRFILRLPLAAAAELLEHNSPTEDPSKPEAA